MFIKDGELFIKRKDPEVSGVYLEYRKGMEWNGNVHNHGPSYADLNDNGYIGPVAFDYDPTKVKLTPKAYDDDGVNAWGKTEPLSPDEIAEAAQAAEDALIAEMTRAIDGHLNAVAISHKYDNIVNACGYAAAPNPFQDESLAFVTWRGNVWAYAYQVLGDVKAGSREQPTVEELIAELPIFNGS